MITIEPVIKAGDILTLIGFMVGGMAVVWSMRGDLRMLAKDVKVQGQRLEKLETIVTIQARQDERLIAMDKLIEDLRRGRGWVQGEVDGLYGHGGKVKS